MSLMYSMASAACSRPNTKKDAMCSLMSTALKPMTGMLAEGGMGGSAHTRTLECRPAASAPLVAVRNTRPGWAAS